MKIWSHPLRDRLFPTLSITGLIVLLRLAGIFQPLEWKAFDLVLRWRPAEPTDTRITLLEITENDIQTELDFPIPDSTLATLLQTLQTYNPRVIGIDIFRDSPIGDGQETLARVLKTNSNIIGINKIDDLTSVQAPAALTESQIGFADALLDDDGYLRRSFLGSADAEGNYRFSLTIRLVEQYLKEEDLILENGIKDSETMRFGELEIPRFRPHTGGYIRVDNGGNQTLINFRAGQTPFSRLSYTQLISGQVDPSLLEDRIVIVGYTAESIKDFVSSAAVASESPSLVPGLEIQAHAVSQILSAFYDNRPFIYDLPELIDYLLILSGGLLGMALALWQKKPTLHWLIVIAISISWLLFCYGLAIASWWIPLVPVLATFSLNAIGLYPLYQTKAQLKAQVAERKALINWTYNTIHNGPLQLLASILSDWPTTTALTSNDAKAKLEELNKELRNIYEAMHQEMLLTDETLVVTGQRTIDLKVPIDAVLYETYQATLERQSIFFKKVIQIATFEPISDKKLTPEKKRELARFLEEALINVYKYAKTATRLYIDCRQEGKFNVIRVVDNGKKQQRRIHHLPSLSAQIQKMTSHPSGQKSYGTQQAERLAKQLGGQFIRTAVKPHGTCCELRWPVRAAKR